MIASKMKKYTDMCHSAGKIYMSHACGNVKQFLNDILETGIDAHHYLTEEPVGNIRLKEVYDLWENKICIMAALDPLLLAIGSVQEVENNIKSILSQVNPTENFILMSALKPDISEEKIRMIPRVLQEYRK
jgi:uroporphyrinogen-III decarboxylase